MIGVALRRADSSTSSPGRLVWNSARASALRRIRSDSVCFPSRISFAPKRSLTRCDSTWYLDLRGIDWRRGILLLLPGRLGDLGPVLAAALLAVRDSRCVQRPADDVVLDGREVLHPATAHQNHRMLLE